MTLNFTECNYMNEGLFADFARYHTVEKYLQAVVDVMLGRMEFSSEDTPNFVPVDCAVKDMETGTYRYIMQNGQVAEDAEKNIRWVKRLPAYLRHFLSDNIVIRGDGFRRELFISWD